MPRISKRAIDAAKPGTVLQDSELPGFQLRVGKTRKTFLLYFRLHGAERRPAIGTFGEMTVDQARDIAREWRQQIAKGIDPTAARVAKTTPTMIEFADRYQKEYAEPRKTVKAADQDRGAWNKHILPSMGKKRIDEITREDVGRLHAAMKDTPIQANRVRSILSKALNLAEKWYLRPENTNPCRHVEKYPENKRKRYLSKSEAAALGKALEHSDRFGGIEARVADIVRMLIFTGARLHEIRDSRRKSYDLANGVLTVTEHKTAKTFGPKYIQLPASAVAVMARVLESHDSEFAFPGKAMSAPVVGFHKIWWRIRDVAGLTEFHPHDLRHSFASAAASSGASLAAIGALLGHTEPSTTARYAHLYADPLKAAANAAAGQLDDWLSSPAIENDDKQATD